MIRSIQDAKRSKQLKIAAWLIIGLGIASLAILPRMAAGFPEVEIQPGPPPIPLDPEETARYEQMEEIGNYAFGALFRFIHFWAWFYPISCLLVGAVILHRRFYTLSVLGAALVFTGVFPIGMILGGWAIFLLCNRDTKQLFQKQTELGEADFLD